MVTSNLYLSHSPDREKANRLENGASREEIGGEGRFDKRVKVSRVCQRENECEYEWAQSDTDTRPAVLRREYARLFEQFEAFADDFGQTVQDLGEIAAADPLDADCRIEKARVLRGDPPLDPAECLTRIERLKKDEGIEVP